MAVEWFRIVSVSSSSNFHLVRVAWGPEHTYSGFEVTFSTTQRPGDLVQ
jgi:hypothetical protein